MLCHELTISLLFRPLYHLAAETVNILLIPLPDLQVFAVVQDFTFLDLLPDDIGKRFILQAFEVFLLVFLLHLLAKAILVVLMGVLNAETSYVFGLLVIDLLIFHCLHVSLFILTTEGGKVFAIHIVLQSLSL